MADLVDLEETRQKLIQEEELILSRIEAENKILHSGTINPDRTDLAQTYAQGQRTSAMLERLESQLHQVRGALARLSDGTYGKCQECGQTISSQRLQAIPRATLCISCQEKLEQR